jgi:hypothetical protein
MYFFQEVHEASPCPEDQDHRANLQEPLLLLTVVRIRIGLGHTWLLGAPSTGWA